MWHRTSRDEELLSLLRLNGRASVGELAKTLGTGPATIRRDLRRLAVEGRLVRTYGGAAVATARPHDDGHLDAALEKRAIAAKAAELVEDGDTIVVSSGTTTLEFARRLVGHRRLCVITNSLDVANVLLDQGIELIVLGGAVRPEMHSMLGHLTDLAAAELRADAFFLGITAISLDRGLMSDHMPEILTDRALSRIAGRIVVLADADKFNRSAPAFVLGLGAVSTIVTDSRVPVDTVAGLEQQGIQVVIADPARSPVRHDGAMKPESP
jgi:DeoR/GlpR family transcriptional regulator of sugar metabolism